ncbi:MAG: protein kinase domain-containing protein [Thermoanaerobaculia bacterium]
MKLGRYEVVRELGKGAMGIVYLAKDPLIGRLVALKTIRPAAYSDDDETKEFQQRFIREAQAAGILNHPGIVTVHDIGLDDSTGISFISMEYVEGHNVKEILAQGRALSFDQIGDIVAQIADALDFAHSKGIVHRDVKPANIIILEGNRAKITDFGIAKIASGVANLTSTGQFLGTPNYMAPEQIKGAPVDGRTDIFSLGICLYECLTRRKPFGGESLTSISYKIVHEPFPPLHEINPQIPEGYSEVVAFCLAKDPARRYQRAKDLATALRAVLRGEKPVKSEPILEEETIITHDRDKQPTIDMPFPDSADADPNGWMTQAAKPSGAAVAVPPSVPRPAAKGPRQPSVPIRERFNQTFTRVRTHPSWRSRISPYLVAIIVGLLIASLAGAVLLIQRQKPKLPLVDQRAEQRRARERQLREEGNALLQQGRIHEAYTKFEQLNKMAPASPAVSEIVQKLDAIRQKEEISKQQIAFAKQKRDEGIDMVNQRKFAEAIALLQESYTANPTDDLTTTYLRLAQVEQQKADAEKLAKDLAATNRAGTTGRPPGSTTAADARAASNAPAQLTTSFEGPFTDGYMMVKVGGDTIAHENLYEEKGRFIRRNVPRAISVTSRFPPRDADVQVWIVVPSLKITEHRAIRHNFKPGSVQKLQVTFNPQTKTFDYQMK